MQGHMYHWKHGWIPLDHYAALVKAKGLSETTLRAMVKSTQDAKIREQFMKELNRRGVHIGR